MDAAAELGRNPVSSTRFSLSMDMSRLTRDGTAEPISRDQILRHARGQRNIIFPVQLTLSRIGNPTRLIHTLAICDDHTYIHTYYVLLNTDKRSKDGGREGVLYMGHIYRETPKKHVVFSSAG